MSKKYTAPALEKGLDIIELLSWEDAGLTQAEIARALDRSVSEIFRMLIVLGERGYVALNSGSDRYQLTSLIFEIANRTPAIKRLTSVAIPIMQSLCKTMNQSAHLGILNGDSILVVAQQDSPGYNVLSVKLGARIEACYASSAWVILAHQPETEIKSFFQNTKFPKDFDVEAMQASLPKIREQGYEMHSSFRLNGVTNISAPIIDHRGVAIAALTTPFIERIGQQQTVETARDMLVKATKQLTKQIGGGDISQA